MAYRDVVCICLVPPHITGEPEMTAYVAGQLNPHGPNNIVPPYVSRYKLIRRALEKAGLALLDGKALREAAEANPNFVVDAKKIAAVWIDNPSPRFATWCIGGQFSGVLDAGHYSTSNFVPVKKMAKICPAILVLPDGTWYSQPDLSYIWSNKNKNAARIIAAIESNPDHTAVLISMNIKLDEPGTSLDLLGYYP